MSQILQLSILPLGIINAFLIKGTNKHILVDTGIPKSKAKIMKQLALHGIGKKDISLIVVTHGHIDHSGSAAELSKALEAPILIHEKDAVALRTGTTMVETLNPNKPFWNVLRKKLIKDRSTPCEPDITLSGSAEYSLQQWGIEGKIIHTPGHTPGSLSIILGNGEAIIADLAASGILLGGILFKSRVKHPPFHDDKKTLALSIRKVLSEKCHTFYLGHGGPISRKGLEKYVNKFLQN